MPSILPYNDECTADGRDWIDCLKKLVFDGAPQRCPVGEIGLATQTSGPAFTSNCVAANTSGTMTPASFWTPVFDYYAEYERDRKIDPIRQAQVTHQSSQLYSLGNNVDAHTQAYVATSNQAYLLTALEICEAVIATAVPNNELQSNILGVGISYPDTYLSFDVYGMSSLGYATPGGQSPQNEAQFYKQALYMVAKAQQDASVTGALAARIEAVRSWIEVNGFEKWWLRGAPPGVPENEAYLLLEQVNHFDGYSRWASISMLLKQTAGNSAAGLTNAANWPNIVTLNTKLVDGFTSTVSPFYNKGLRPNMINHPNDAAAWWWNRNFDGVTTGGGDDVSHSNHLVRYICDAVEFGLDGWTAADLDRLRYTFLNHLYDGDAADPQTAFDMLGGANYRNDWLQDGWFSLGRTNLAFAAIIQNKQPWPSNYWSQHFGHLMRNAVENGAP